MLISALFKDPGGYVCDYAIQRVQHSDHDDLGHLHLDLCRECHVGSCSASNGFSFIAILS